MHAAGSPDKDRTQSCQEFVALSQQIAAMMRAGQEAKLNHFCKRLAQVVKLQKGLLFDMAHGACRA